MTNHSSELQELLFDRIPKPRKFEDRLWNAADNLRANARLKSSEYAAPLLGLFFLRYASNRFNSITPQANQEFEASKDNRNSETIEEVYKRLCGFYLPESSRYETLLNLKGEDNAQEAVIEAMDQFEKLNPNAGVTLPKTITGRFPTKRCAKFSTSSLKSKSAKAMCSAKSTNTFWANSPSAKGKRAANFTRRLRSSS